MGTAVVRVADWAAVARENNVDLASLLMANRIVPTSPYPPPVVGQTVKLPDASQTPASVAGGADHQIAAGPPLLKTTKIRLNDSSGQLLTNAKYIITYPSGAATTVAIAADGILTLTLLQQGNAPASTGAIPAIIVHWGADSVDEHTVTIPLLPPDTQVDVITGADAGAVDPANPYNGVVVEEMFISLARKRVGFLTSLGMLLGDVATDLKPNKYKVWSNPRKPGEWLIEGPGMTPGYRFDVDFSKIHLDYTKLTYPNDEQSALTMTVLPGMTKFDKYADLFDPVSGDYLDPTLVWEGVPLPLPVTDDDDFDALTYFVDYRAEHGGASKILRASYRDNSVKEFNIDDITSATPRLFAAKQNTLNMIYEDFTLYVMHDVFPVVFGQITTLPLTPTPNVTIEGAVASPRPAYAPRALPRTILDGRAQFSGLNWIQRTNPTLNTTNCGNCSIAVDWTMSGQPMEAAPTATGVTPRAVEGYYNATARVGSRWATGASGTAQWQSVADRPAIENQMRAWGEGSQAIVLGMRGTSPGHFFFATYRGQQVYFLDGQTMKYASFEGFYPPPGLDSPFGLLRTVNTGFTGELAPLFPKRVDVTATPPVAITPSPIGTQGNAQGSANADN